MALDAFREVDPDGVQWADLVEQGRDARAARDGAQWTLGELAAEVVTTYREHSLERYAQEIGVEYNTLREYERVYSSYDKENATRVANLSWSHHREVAALEPEKRSDLLEQAVEHKWSRRELRAVALPTAGIDLATDDPDVVSPFHLISTSSESPEWYTPKHVIEIVEGFLGGIDLDPCSNSHDAPNVPAKQRFTVADNGLAHQWSGTVYMNPPYGDAIGAWVRKLHDEYIAGRVTEAIALVPDKRDTQWWDVLSHNIHCAITGRLTFTGQDTNYPAPFPSALIYVGKRWDDFTAAFRELGHIYGRLD